MNDDDLPHTIWSGSVKVMGMELKCHVLSDGRRIIEADSVDQFIRAMADPTIPDDQEGLEALAKWKDGN